MPRVLLAAVVVLATSLSLNSRVAIAGPPFVTDDPEPVELRHWEFYFASQVNHTADARSGAAPFVDANFGAIPDLHLHVLVPMAFDAPSPGDRHYGCGDTEVGAKYRFIHETARLPQAALYPALEIPTGDERLNLGAGHVQAFLPIWIQKSWGGKERPWTAYGGGGYFFQFGQGDLDWGFFGLVLQRQVRKNLLLGGEVIHQTAADAAGTADTELNFGTTVDLSEKHHLLFSAGRSVDGPSLLRMYFAYQLLISPRGSS